MFHITNEAFVALDPWQQVVAVLTRLLVLDPEQEGCDGAADEPSGADPSQAAGASTGAADGIFGLAGTDVMTDGPHPAGPGGGYEESGEHEVWTFFLVRGREEALELLRGLADADGDGLVPDAFFAEVSHWNDPEVPPEDFEVFCGIELEGLHWTMSQKEQLKPLERGGLQWDQFIKDGERRPVGILYGFRDEVGVHRIHLARSRRQVRDLARRVGAWDPKGAAYVLRDEDGDVARLPESSGLSAVELHGIIAERINTQYCNVYGGEDPGMPEEHLAKLPPSVAAAARELRENARKGLERDRFKDHKGGLN